MSYSVKTERVAGKTLHTLIQSANFLISLLIALHSAHSVQPHWWLLFWRYKVFSTSRPLHLLFSLQESSTLIYLIGEHPLFLLVKCHLRRYTASQPLRILIALLCFIFFQNIYHTIGHIIYLITFKICFLPVFSYQNVFSHEGGNSVFSLLNILPPRIIPCNTVGVYLMNTFVFLFLWIA